ncbi:DUF885 domain-containing protein [Williamsia sp. CHRR-6]|uniref:DUF885 domain-containing protein n=1 Tax=Williamsia sp. CHRR-6 TaxID=2835871 RepID=UPI001BDB2335|nr:DUF885 domain-containing protein [Williamsia sp. CHRR-6]MBT0567989.1 DUF885 domain-containing protein [Williamsia sp. CHRR-6]
MADLDPVFATEIGVGGRDDRLTDYSPAGCAARTDAARHTLSALAAAPITDEVDRISVATISAQLNRTVAIDEAGLRVGELNVIASPLQAMRDAFDAMSVDSADDRTALVDRVAAVPRCIDGIIAGLRARAAAGPAPARRQVDAVAAQAPRAITGIAAKVAEALARDGDLESASTAALGAARTALDDLARVLVEEIGPTAVDHDAVGRDRYTLHSAHFVGDVIDPEEAYAWGLEQMAAVIAEQEQLAEIVAPGAGVRGALSALDADPRYLIEGSAAFAAWMQELSDRSLTALAGTHFDIPAELGRLECCIAPAATGGIYYTAPSEDMSRPGRMWWSVPPQQQTFHTWQETTTVFHEGVPGHHLQIGQAMISPELNRWRKLASFSSGHGEGWALYSERLMGELGWLDDPGDRLGMLDSQRLRIARVIVDIGVHCAMPAPEAVGGGTWDADKAWTYLTDAVAMQRSVLRFELDRYLGWPGQAPSYALGQRVWQQARDTFLTADPTHTLREFHSRALRLGGVSLDVLRSEFAAG